MQSDGALCEICYVGHFTLEDGVLICDQCGTQSQVRERWRWQPKARWSVLDLTPTPGLIAGI